MKIAIVGGHLTPALSVIEELGNHEIFYIGRKHAIEGDKSLSLEYQTIIKKGIVFEEIKTGRFQRSFTKYTIPSLVRIPLGLYQAVKILKKRKPDVVVGFGGYVSFPVVLAAKFLKIPSLIHEQTLEAGAANKALGKYADRICISFESSAKFFPKDKTVLTGNPVRKSITNPEAKFRIESKDPIIYITGGSLGSHFINQLVMDNLAQILDKYILVHQTGGSTKYKDFNKLSILKEGLNNNKKDRYIVSKFFSPEEVGAIMKSSSLIISRAGVNTVSEIIILKKPAFLIPLPVSQKDEQLKNALFMKQVGLAEVKEQNKLDNHKFIKTINEIMNNLENYKLDDYTKHFPKNAAKKIVENIYDLQKNSN